MIRTEPVAKIFPLSLIYSILSASRIFSLFVFDLSSLLWSKINIIKNMKKNNITEIIEVGPKNVLTRLIQKIDPSIKTKSFDKVSDIMSYGMQKGLKKQWI